MFWGAMMRPGRSEPAVPDCDVVAAVADRVFRQDPGQLVTSDPGHAFLAGPEDPGGELPAIPVEDPHQIDFVLGTGHGREYADPLQHWARLRAGLILGCMDTPDPRSGWSRPPPRRSGVLTRRDVEARDRVEDFRALRLLLTRRSSWLAPVREVTDRFRPTADLGGDTGLADTSAETLREDVRPWEEDAPASTAAWTSLDPPP